MTLCIVQVLSDQVPTGPTQYGLRTLGL